MTRININNFQRAQTRTLTPFLNKISLNFFAEQYSLKFQRAYQLIQKKTLDEQKARLKAQNILMKAQQDALRLKSTH